jgi:endoglucanase
MKPKALKRFLFPSIVLNLFLFVSTSFSQRIVDQYDKLSVKGNQIVDKNGNAVQLKGISFFWSQWIGKYYNYNTVKWLRDDWHCSVIRAAMAIEEGGYLTNPVSEEQKVDSVVNAAIKLGIYVVIDWHDHHAQRRTVQAQNFFAEIAKKYGQYPNIIYETFNEPLNISWTDSIKPYHIAVIDSIRKYDPDNIIVCGTRAWSQNVDEASLSPIERTNIAYTLHYYAATHKQWLRNKALTAVNNGIALFVTEFGTCEHTGDGMIDYDESRIWWKFLNQHKISWCNWVIADHKQTSAALKPNASANGGWDSTMLTPSGKLVRLELRKK